ncbi:BQ5605_C003g02248 [Microbotryum silenes-dioicae]|uniref:Ammonium transporter n=1 Tax=Microbotryum silenes-dioicae TaxID=796604 RepID=A0A2X0M123_9BASI|nr:BQ5605_C003g02248 [Microbotryum silenes-dioicae]
MANITYGALINAASQVVPVGESYGINAAGTDLIVTGPEYGVAAYSSGTFAAPPLYSRDMLMIPGVGSVVDRGLGPCSLQGYSARGSLFGARTALLRSEGIALHGFTDVFAPLVRNYRPTATCTPGTLCRRKNALTVLSLTMLCMGIVSFQWFFWGYSLAFSPTGGPFLGDLHFFVLRNVAEQPVPQANNKVPQIVYMIYQNMFAALVPAVFIGAAAERGRVLPACIFFFCWSTVVYCPVAHWIWAPEGWAFKLGVLDYAGGGPIEICSGVTGLVYSIFLGKRRGFGTPLLAFKPHNVSYVIQGTIFLWVGWLGFNGGSTFAANFKAAFAIVNTNLAASFGGLAWMLIDYRLERKWSVVGFCTGAICGLVAITPAAGYVGPAASVFIGVIAASISNLLTTLKGIFNFDDAMDIYACHGVAGIVGLVFTGVFAEPSYTGNDGYSTASGWIKHNYIQVGYQLGYICAVWGYTFVVCFALMFLINLIPGCKFRVDENQEIVGTDDAELGEWAYDYVVKRRDIEAPDELRDYHSQSMVQRPLAEIARVSGNSSSLDTAIPPASEMTASNALEKSAPAGKTEEVRD